MDSIFISELTAAVIVGTLPEERCRRQKVIFDLELSLDLGAASQHDALEYTVDYSRLEDEITVLAESSSFLLIEALAGAVAGHIMSFSESIVSCRVKVTKPGASRRGTVIAAEIRRSRNDV